MSPFPPGSFRRALGDFGVPRQDRFDRRVPGLPQAPHLSLLNRVLVSLHIALLVVTTGSGSERLPSSLAPRRPYFAAGPSGPRWSAACLLLLARVMRVLNLDWSVSLLFSVCPVPSFHSGHVVWVFGIPLFRYRYFLRTSFGSRPSLGDLRSWSLILSSFHQLQLSFGCCRWRVQ